MHQLRWTSNPRPSLSLWACYPGLTTSNRSLHRLKARSASIVPLCIQRGPSGCECFVEFQFRFWQLQASWQWDEFEFKGFFSQWHVFVNLVMLSKKAATSIPSQVLVGTNRPKIPIRFQSEGEGFGVLSEQICRSTKDGFLQNLAVPID